MNRVLHITPTYFPAVGGIETVVRSLVKHSREQGVVADVLHAAPNIISASEDLLDDARVFRRPLRPHRLLGWILGLGDVAGRYELLHVHDPQLMALSFNALMCSKPIRRVLSTHGGFFHTRKLASWKQLHWDLVAPHVLRRYDLVLASSTSDAVKFAERSANVKLVPNGVDVAKFLSVQRESGEKLTRWIFWGRLSRNKRVDLVIDLVARVRAAGLDVKLTVAGSDFDGVLDDAREQVRRAGLADHVSFVGPISDRELLAILGAHTVFITASEHEGFGLSVIEAMSAGLTVICRDMAPLNEFVQPGANGVLLKFDGENEDVAKVLSFCWVDTPEVARLSARARDAARAHDWAVAVTRFHDAYFEVFGRVPQ